MRFSGLSVRQLEAFDVTMRCGSVSRAAVLLHISQPSVSRLLQDLEHDTGLQLFDRSQGRLVPTIEGQLFHQEVEKTFSSAQRLMNTAQQIRQLQRGGVRVGGMAALALELLPRVMRAFYEQYPAAGVKLSVIESARIVAAVAAHTMDLGVIDADTLDGSVDCILRADYPSLCVMSDRHPLAAQQSVAIENLAVFPFVSPGIDVLHRTADGRRLAEAVIGNIQAEVFQSFLACPLVMDTQALALVDPFTAGFYQRLGLVTRPLQADIPFRVAVIANSRSKGALAPSRFVQQLVLALDELGVWSQGERVYGIDLYRRRIHGSSSTQTRHDHARHPSGITAIAGFDRDAE